MDVLSAEDRHVAGYVRHQTEVERVSGAELDLRLATLRRFYD